MSPKFLLLLIALCAVTEARHFLKKLHQKEQSLSFVGKSNGKIDAAVRRRRDTDKEASSSEEVTSAEAVDLIKFFVNVAWQEDKKEVLGSFLEEVTDTDTNITLIGWQRVLDGTGKVVEIRTIQLVIPPQPLDEYPSNIVQDEDDDDEVDEWGEDRIVPYGIINELKEIFDPLAAIGIPASVTFEEYSEDGKLEGLIYLDKDELYASADGFSIYNKTTVASPEEVSNFITSLKPGALGKPSVLKFDVDGHLIKEQSNIKAYVWGGVNEDYEAPADVLLRSPQIIAELSLEYPKEQLAKQLALAYNEAFPKYKWKVLVDPSETYITRDVTITLTYDNFDLSEDSYVSYLVYGVKKESKQ